MCEQVGRRYRWETVAKWAWFGVCMAFLYFLGGLEVLTRHDGFLGGHAWVSFIKGKDGDLGLFIIGGGYRCFIPYVVGKVNVGVGRCYIPKREGMVGTRQKEAGVEKEADDDMIWVNFIRFKLYRLSSFSLVN